MPVFFAYLLKLSCSLAMVYLFYQLVLRRLTFYTANRWYLLGYSLLCFFIPLINISRVIEQHRLSRSAVVRAIPALDNYTHATKPLLQHNTAASFMLWHYSFLLLIIGVLVLLTRLLIQYASYRAMRKQAQLISDNGIAIYQVSKSIIPFSFGNAIFINQGLHSEAELKEIIRHEFVHVTQRHTVDIICAEMVCLLNWYNPFAWLLRHAVRQNLEFIADNNVIESGVDKRDYQYLLLKVMGLPQFSIAAPFNFSSLKKRIVMMNKMKSAKAHLVKFLFVLPLLAVLLLAFRSEQVRQKEYAAIVVNDTVPPPPPPVVTPPVPAAPNVSVDVAAAPEAIVGIGVDGDTSLLPDDYKSFLDRNPGIKNIQWTGRTVIVELKSGKKEAYQLDNKKSMAEAERKWGKLPAAPPPPPPPPAVAPPVPPVPADTVGINGGPVTWNDMYQQKLEFLQNRIEQLNDSVQSGHSNKNSDDVRSLLNERSFALQQEQQGLQNYLQQKEMVSEKEQKEMVVQLQRQQQALAQDQRKVQALLQQAQHELQQSEAAAREQYLKAQQQLQQKQQELQKRQEKIKKAASNQAN